MHLHALITSNKMVPLTVYHWSLNKQVARRGNLEEQC